MHASGEDAPSSLDIKGSFHELSVTAYAGRLKVVGLGSFGVGLRTSSRRPSDFLRSVSDSRLTLADVSIYDARSGDLLDSAPFVVLNLDRVELLYVRDDASASTASVKETGRSAADTLGDRAGGSATERLGGPAGSA